MEIFYELEDITLLPSALNGGHPGNINFLVEDKSDFSGIPKSLPIFTSPMEAIIGERNAKIFQDHGIKPVLPLSEPIEVRLEYCQWIFCAFSLIEVKKYFIDSSRKHINSQFHICFDVGNGHDQNLLDLCGRLKQLYGGQVIVMGGNVGCPEIYSNYARAGFDYMRIGIASGSLVDTSTYGFHWPMASLLDAIKTFKKSAGAGLPKQPKIIADGGIQCYSDIVKALALGADYVMIGRQFASVIEAAGDIYQMNKAGDGIHTNKEKIDPSQVIGMKGIQARNNGFSRQYYGSTSPEMRAFRAGYPDVESWMKRDKAKVSDTSWSWVEVDHNLDEWVEEFKHCAYYAFMMTGTNNWDDFKKCVRYGLAGV